MLGAYDDLLDELADEVTAGDAVQPASNTKTEPEYQVEIKTENQFTEKQFQPLKDYTIMVERLNGDIVNNALLKDAFQRYNPLNAKVCFTTKNGSSKCLNKGKVVFSNPEDMEAALNEMNGITHEISYGRLLCRPAEERDQYLFEKSKSKKKKKKNKTATASSSHNTVIPMPTTTTATTTTTTTTITTNTRTRHENTHPVETTPTDAYKEEIRTKKNAILSKIQQKLQLIGVGLTLEQIEYGSDQPLEVKEETVKQEREEDIDLNME